MLTFARFTVHGIPALCVHDSFLVPYTHVRLLKAYMRRAAREVVGVELAVEASAPGLDEMADSSLEVQQDFISWMQSPRCPGYFSRLTEHERLWGSLQVLPEGG